MSEGLPGEELETGGVIHEREITPEEMMREAIERIFTQPNHPESFSRGGEDFPITSPAELILAGAQSRVANTRSLLTEIRNGY